jgi:hypothetical protein
MECFARLPSARIRIAQVDVRDLSILRWTDRCYYEVCANPAVYAALPGEKSAPASKLELKRARLKSRPLRFRNFAEPETESPPPLPAPRVSPLFPRARTSSGPELSPHKRRDVRPGCRGRECRPPSHRINDGIECDHAVHVGANQFQRIAGIRFFHGHRLQQFARLSARHYRVPQT